MLFLSRYISEVNSRFYVKYLKKHNILNVKSCFDIGSSTGAFVDALNNLGIDTEGIEPRIDIIKSKKVKHGLFDLKYTTDKKYDLITISQTIFFIDDFEAVCEKLISMLNPNGIIFIVTILKMDTEPLTYTDLKTYPIHTIEEYQIICKKLNVNILDFTSVQSNLGIAFNCGKIKAIQRLFSYIIGLKAPIKEAKLGNNLYMLLKLN